MSRRLEQVTALLEAAARMASHFHIAVTVIKEENEMATIKERLAALETGLGDSAANKAELDTLTARVDAVETEIGTDAPTAGTIDPATGLPA